MKEHTRARTPLPRAEPGARHQPDPTHTTSAHAHTHVEPSLVLARMVLGRPLAKHTRTRTRFAPSSPSPWSTQWSVASEGGAGSTPTAVTAQT
eukprot:COSAG01_NODE_46467_length_400_cov_0.292359_1_plen_92_part_10